MRRAASSPLSWLELAVLIHTGGLLIGSTWFYGGNTGWMRLALSIWGSLGAGLTISALLQAGASGRDARKKITWLIPFALFSGLVLISAANPSFRPVYIDGGISFVKSRPAWIHWPSSISPGLSLRAWWFGTGVYLSALNLALVLKSRSALRALLALVAVNTFILSVFGTLQKLIGAGFYFGAAQSPNPRFFATFFYYNHWGAFMILGLTTAIGLLFYHTRRQERRDLWHSPFSAALIGVLLIATSAPVSASRASTVIVAIILLVAMVHALSQITITRRARQLSPWPPLMIIIILSVVTTSAVGWLSYRSLSERYTETRLIIDQDKSVFGGRAELYRDTWNLARQKPVFGWGLDTYAIGFQLIRPFTVDLRNLNPNAYATAHSDWLQSVAETGFVGTGLLLLIGIVPLSSVPRRLFTHPLTGYPLFGCALVLLYAWIEFPFACGAVMITFWALFFIAIRHAELSARLEKSPT